MVAVVSNRELFIAAGDKQRKKSTRLANALAVELLNSALKPRAKGKKQIEPADLQSLIK